MRLRRPKEIGDAVRAGGRQEAAGTGSAVCRTRDSEHRMKGPCSAAGSPPVPGVEETALLLLVEIL